MCNEKTVREELPQDATVVESGSFSFVESSLGAPIAFQEYPILKTLPTKGAEADLYLVDRGGEPAVLKLYRHSVVPNRAVLHTIAELSRENARHLVRIWDAGFDPALNRWYELMEYLPHGSLQDIPLGTVDREKLVRAVLYDLAGALNVLHRHGIVHCDLKPSNILLRALSPMDLVLTDFGISSQLAADVTLKVTVLKGTPLYWAPESFSSLLSATADWWGLGVIALELLCGKHPFIDLSQQQITYQLTIKNIEVPLSLGELATPIRGLLTKDIQKRWGYVQLLDWLKGRRDIPVCYEDPSQLDVPSLPPSLPFYFEKKGLNSLREIAEEFAKNPKNWQEAHNTFFQIRTWLEKKTDFDAAIELAKIDESYLDENVRLFHFVHSNASLPFCYVGLVLDTKVILEAIVREQQAPAELSTAELLLLQAVDNEVLLQLFLDYVVYSHKKDAYLQKLITLLCSMGKEERYACAQALLAPNLFIWPKDCPSDCLMALYLLGAPPLERVYLAGLEEEFVLPTVVLQLLGKMETYTQGALTLQQLRSHSLLIRKESPLSEAEKARSQGDLKQYKEIAQKHNWGLDDAFAAEIARASLALEKESRKIGCAAEGSAMVARLQQIRKRKVTDADRNLVSAVTEQLRILRGDGEALNREVVKGALPIVTLILVFGIALLFPVDDATLSKVFYTAFVVVASVLAFFLDIFFNSLMERRRRRAWPSGVLLLVGLFSSMLSASVINFLARYVFWLHVFKNSVLVLLFCWLSLRWYRMYRERRKASFIAMLAHLEENQQDCS